MEINAAEGDILSPELAEESAWNSPHPTLPSSISPLHHISQNFRTAGTESSDHSTCDHSDTDLQSAEDNTEDLLHNYFTNPSSRARRQYPQPACMLVDI